MADSLKVNTDIGRNRLYLKASGKITKKELDRIYTDIRFQVADLKPGFDVISNYTDCKFLELSGIPTFRKIMNYLINNGVNEIVRVMQGNSLFFKQIMNLASRLQGYKPICVSTFEAAEQKLDELAKRSGLRIHFREMPVKYVLDSETEHGQVLNMSTSGIAVTALTSQPSVGKDILILFGITNEDGGLDSFKIKGKVVRAEEDFFAATFTDFEDDRKDKLWDGLVRESQKELAPA